MFALFKPPLDASCLFEVIFGHKFDTFWLLFPMRRHVCKSCCRLGASTILRFFGKLFWPSCLHHLGGHVSRRFVSLLGSVVASRVSLGALLAAAVAPVRHLRSSLRIPFKSFGVPAAPLRCTLIGALCMPCEVLWSHSGCLLAVLWRSKCETPWILASRSLRQVGGVVPLWLRGRLEQLRNRCKRPLQALQMP